MYKAGPLTIFEADDVIEDIIDASEVGLVVPPFRVDDIYFTTKVLSNIEKRAPTKYLVPALAFIIKQEGKELLDTLISREYTTLFIPQYVTENQFDKVRAWYWQGILEDMDLYFEAHPAAMEGEVWKRNPTWHPVTRDKS